MKRHGQGLTGREFKQRQAPGTRGACMRYTLVVFSKPHSPSFAAWTTDRGEPLPDVHGDALVEELFQQINEEEAISEAIGVDLAPPAPLPEHAPSARLSLEAWWLRSEEVHRFLEEARRREHGARRNDD